MELCQHLRRLSTLQMREAGLQPEVVATFSASDAHPVFFLVFFKKAHAFVGRFHSSAFLETCGKMTVAACSLFHQCGSF